MSATTAAFEAGDLVDYSYVREEFGQTDGLRHTMYLTGVSTDLTREEGRAELGVLVTPASGLHAQTGNYDWFGADNGRYVESKRGLAFDPDAWLTWLDRLDRNRCLFAALPDVLHWLKDDDGKDFCVGDLDATLTQSAEYVDTVKAMGFAVALVAQDGLRSLAQVPFAVDALFIGGSDEYKLGEDVRALVAEARELGLWVHVGRVNSKKRIRYSASIGADSADGTFLRFCRKSEKAHQHGRMMRWLDALLDDAVRNACPAPAAVTV